MIDQSIQSKLAIFIISFIFFTQSTYGQSKSYDLSQFSKADTLRGALNPMRSCYDVKFYNLDLDLDTKNKSLSGYVDFHIEVVDDFELLQFDLFENMQIEEVIWNNTSLKFKREANAVFLQFPEMLKAKENIDFRVNYHGKPIIANTPPWDGGFIWEKDEKDRPWIAVACEGIGASLWWPNKDHLSDEPDSLKIAVKVPSNLKCISNGNLISEEKFRNKTKFTWKVSYPINNYNVSINVGHYSHFNDQYIAFDKDTLALDYYVLDYNIAKAQKHFEQVKPMLEAYEHYFGKYPFWNDGYALIETPYLGMEHQSGIAYGNKFMRGYLGRNIPDGMDWDFIIIHETGHEYWGNSISSNDHAEMWIHESFTTYMEALYVEYLYSYDQAVDYLKMQESWIRNLKPIIGPLDVNFTDFKSSDHYFKGSWVLHTLRNVIDDDELWFGILKSFHEEYKISNIDTRDFIEYLNTKTGKNYDYFFDQYLYKAEIPILEYVLFPQGENLKISFRWKNTSKDFKMPIKAGVKGNYKTVYPSQKTFSMVFKNTSPHDFQIAQELFLVNTSPLKKKK